MNNVRFNLLTTYLKGMTMGAADVIPGVSGGTIALITHIYERLIRAINGISLKLVLQLLGTKRKEAWRALDGAFLLSLALGIGTSILLFTSLIEWLLEAYPIPLWAFFFGLILGSAVVLKNKVTSWRFSAFVALLTGALVAYGVGVISPSAGSENLLYLFFCGMLVVIAMILPGISGAFILILLGAYQTALETVAKLKSFDPEGLIVFAVMASGGLIGLKLFSKGLNWMFLHYKNTVLAAMTGFLIGSLFKVWPWKKTMTYHTNSEGVQEPLTTIAVFPDLGDASQQLGSALLSFFVALVLLFFLERISKKNSDA